jgi:hypothetical protein
LRTFLFFCGGAIFAFQSVPITPLALIVLDPSKLSAERLPAGWALKVKSGQAEFSTTQDGDVVALHFESVKSSFSMERNVDVDLAKMPYLTWHWKVVQVPKGGDFRHYSSDDQAAQVLVAFDERHVLTYIWDTTAPQGTMDNASAPPLMHIYAIVCRSGTDEVNQWLAESHNVAADYLKAFGKPAPRVKGLRLQINSQHTGTIAESYFADVAFRNTAQ